MTYCLRKILKENLITDWATRIISLNVTQLNEKTFSILSVYTKCPFKISSLIRNAHIHPRISPAEKYLSICPNIHRLQYNARTAINHSLLSISCILLFQWEAAVRKKKYIKQKSRKWLCEKILPANRHIFNYILQSSSTSPRVRMTQK